MDDSIKSTETPEAVELLNHLQHLLSQHGIKLKKWISNNDAVTVANQEHLKLISNTKQVEVGPNTEVSSALGLQSTVTDDNLQETPITKRKILSLVSSEAKFVRRT